MSIVDTVVTWDKLLGDIAATQYLLDDAIEERDALRLKVAQLTGELGNLRARLTWMAYR